VLLHGWPDSVLRFERVLPLLADMHVVVPALPGFPLAAPLTVPGMSADRIAGIVADPAKLAPDAAAYLGRSAQWFRAEGGYIAEQSTRPNTLAVALGDSPARLAAWIVEELESWSDESAFTPGELLTWVTAYWVTGTIGTSFTTYVEPVETPGRRPLRSLGTARGLRRRPTPCGRAGRLKRSGRERRRTAHGRADLSRSVRNSCSAALPLSASAASYASAASASRPRRWSRSALVAGR
jgi:hypothetical protein